MEVFDAAMFMLVNMEPPSFFDSQQRIDAEPNQHEGDAEFKRQRDTIGDLHLQDNDDQTGNEERDCMTETP